MSRIAAATGYQRIITAGANGGLGTAHGIKALALRGRAGSNSPHIDRIKMRESRSHADSSHADCDPAMESQRWLVVPTAGASRDEKRVLIRQKRPSPASK